MSDADVPLPPPPPQRHGTRPEKPRRPTLTLDQIVTVALELIDEDGVDALSMRNLAQRLGAGAASLYAHVENKEVLLDHVYNRVVAEVEVPDPDRENWAETVKQAMRNQRNVLGAHRDIAKISLARIPTGPEALPVLERTMALLDAGDLPPWVAGVAPDLMALYVDAVSYEHTLYPKNATPEEIEGYRTEMRDYFSALPEDRFPQLRAMAEHLTAKSHEERFEFGLEVIVRGLQAMAEDERKD